MIFLKEHRLQRILFRLLSIISLVTTIVCFTFVPVWANLEKQDEFIFISDIHSGMKGIGKSVFSGIKIEEFGVEVIDIIRGSGVAYSYILVKLSGDKIENNGGISAGMSGSPVYFNGKLAGAISHSWEMSEHNLCLITPIDAMLALFDFVGNDNKNANLNSSLNEDFVHLFYDENQKRIFVHNESLLNKEDIVSSNNDEEIIKFQSIQPPLIINGFYGRADDLLKETLEKYGITLIQNVSGYYYDINPELEIGTKVKNIQPGSAIGVQLSTGDINIMGIGTATYSKDNYVLALGHPFLHRGDVSYLFTSVYIYHSFPSIIMPFKIGSPYLLLGEVIQDRNAGIVARLNKFPNIVSCKIKVSDLGRNLDIVAGVKIVPEKEIVQSVIPALLVQTIDNAINRIGQGTGEIKLSFRNADTGDILNYDNIFFNENDIAIEISRGLSNLFDLLFYNFYEKIDLNEITIDVAISKHNKKAIIKEVVLDSKDYYPGDKIEAKITVTPFRHSDEQRTVQISLPENITTGNAVLTVKGGSLADTNIERSASQEGETHLMNGWKEIEKHLKEKEKNNQIAVELIIFNDENSSNSNFKNGENNIKVTQDTDFIINGYQEVFLNINNKNMNEAE